MYELEALSPQERAEFDAWVVQTQADDLAAQMAEADRATVEEELPTEKVA